MEAEVAARVGAGLHERSEDRTTWRNGYRPRGLERSSPIRHRSAAAQADLAVLRSRQALVRARTDLVNHVRGAVKSLGARLPKCSTDAFARKVADAVPEELRPALLPVLETITRLTDDIRVFDRRVERRCEEVYPATALLRQVAGVAGTRSAGTPGRARTAARRTNSPTRAT